MLGRADVFCLHKDRAKKNEIVEIEVKLTKSDLLNEFNEENLTKHTKYKVLESEGSLYSPNKFYICVPEDLVDFCKEKLEEHNRPYVGIIQYKPKWVHDSRGTWLDLQRSVSVVKSAKKLYKKVSIENYNYFSDLLLHRLRNDVVGFYKEKYYNVDRYKLIKEKK